MSEIIALSGYARSGKSTAAEVLSREFGFEVVAFADALRNFLYAQNPIITSNYDEQGIHPTVHAYTTLRNAIDEYGWQGYKTSPYSDYIRHLIQTTGTEAGRGVVGENIWVDALFNNITADKIAIADCRFTNELDAVVNRGGYVWRIERHGVGPLNAHSSEIEAESYDKFSLRLHNNGTQEEFEQLVISEYKSGRYTEWNYS